MIVNDHCPHCDQKCVTNLRKLTLLPGMVTPCRSCGQNVAVPAFAMVSIFPILFAYMMLFQLPDGPMGLRVGGAIGLTLLAVYYHVFLLPLVAR